MEPIDPKMLDFIGNMVFGVFFVAVVLMAYLLYQVYVTHTYRPDLSKKGNYSPSSPSRPTPSE